MRYELTDFEWVAIGPLLPNKPRCIPRVDDRRVLNGIFWVQRSRAPWRDLAGSLRALVKRLGAWANIPPKRSCDIFIHWDHGAAANGIVVSDCAQHLPMRPIDGLSRLSFPTSGPCPIKKLTTRLVGQPPQSTAEFISSGNATHERFSFAHVLRSFLTHSRS
jgi:transposase